jgi:signal transduction histidine kinase
MSGNRLSEQRGTPRSAEPVSAPRTLPRHRPLWPWFVLTGLTFGVLYAYPMWASVNGAITAWQSMTRGLTHVIPVALAAVMIWRLTGVMTWPPRHRWRFFAIHAAAAAAFGFVWLAIDTSLIAISTGYRIAFEIVRVFAGFQVLDGVIIFAAIAAVSYVVRIARQLREQEARAARAETLRMRAELAAIRGRLNPHFLFNTLHTLTALVRRDPETAEHALERFGDMLRYVLDVKRSSREDVPLADELQFVRGYLSLEQLRFGDRLRASERIDPDALDCPIPTLTLQPLVENAIKYGIAPRAGGGQLDIAASFDGDALVLEVRDDGPGARRDAIEGAVGMGLRAVRQSLETRFAGRARFDVVTAPGEGFAVMIALPVARDAMRPVEVHA